MKTEFLVLTGGPGAGKTAVLEMAKKRFSHHTAFLPEAASMIFSGGFWRLPSDNAKMAAQRAIYHVQCEMENLVAGEDKWKYGLCDRGRLDGLAYWPGNEEQFWEQLGSDRLSEMKRYSTVIHLRTPEMNGGYNHQNNMRVESASEAQIIDRKIERIWSTHPRYLQVPNFPNFFDKARAALELLQKYLPNGTT